MEDVWCDEDVEEGERREVILRVPGALCVGHYGRAIRFFLIVKGKCVGEVRDSQTYDRASCQSVVPMVATWAFLIGTKSGWRGHRSSNNFPYNALGFTPFATTMALRSNDSSATWSANARLHPLQDPPGRGRQKEP